MDQLRMFAEVFRHGGFAAVAKRRNAAPSTVSRGIAALEAELGVRLFTRTTRSLAPTDEGERFMARIAPLLDELGDAVAEARDGSLRPSGLLRISASVSYGQEVVVPLLQPFRDANPDVRVELVLSDRRVDITRERIDVAIRHGRLDSSELVASRLASVRYRLVASGAYLARRGTPREPADLTSHELLSFTYPDFAARWRFRQHPSGPVTELAIRPHTRVSSAVALRMCAERGMGIAVLPDWACRSGSLQRVLPDWEVAGRDFDAALWLVVPTRRYQPLRVTAFLDAVRASAAARPVV